MSSSVRVVGQSELQAGSDAFFYIMSLFTAWLYRVFVMKRPDFIVLSAEWGIEMWTN
jgi:hypothetical protein